MKERIDRDLQKRRRYERRAVRLEEQAQEIIQNPSLTDREKKSKKQEDPPGISSGY